MAERLYYNAQEILDFTAEVTDIRLESRVDGRNRWQVALDRTAFYPESGGQPWDTGRLEAVAPSGARLSVPVLSVVEDAGEVWHVVEKPLTAGTVLTGTVDAVRRRDHMQQHTGQHLLSAVFLRDLGTTTMSFHLGAESSTIDLASPSVGRDELVRVEKAVNEVIAEDRPVRVTQRTRAEAEAMLERKELRKLPDRDGPMRVIEIEGVEWNACGGTHVGSTGRIGGLTIRSTERVKGMVRVEFCCGLRAVQAARRDFEMLGEIGRLLSTGPEEMAGKIGRMLDEARSNAKERRALVEEMAEIEARGLASAGRLVMVRVRDVEYARLLAIRVARMGAVAIVSTVANGCGTVVLAGEGLDCNAAMRHALAACGGRGGGAAGLAQGAVEGAEVERLVAETARAVEAAERY